MRKNFIDNIRIISIMLLFPFHTSMIYNNWGEVFYITGLPHSLPSNFVSIVYPWWMNLLFTLAGISSYYALKKRTIKEYSMERVKKLLIPLIVGLVINTPMQSYIADKFHNNYSGGYFEHYKVFYSKFTYLTGQDGGFTPAHLWFILYLFIISMLMIPIMLMYIKSSKKIDYSKVSMFHLLSMFIVIYICTPLLMIGGKSIGESLACFALGFFILSDELVQDKLVKHRFILVALFLITIIGRIIMQSNGHISGVFWDIEEKCCHGLEFWPYWV